MRKLLALALFLVVGAVEAATLTLSFTPPTHYEDATPATNDGTPLAPGAIGGYRVHYGLNGMMSGAVDIMTPTTTVVNVPNLPAGTYTACVRTLTPQRVQSNACSNTVVAMVSDTPVLINPPSNLVVPATTMEVYQFIGLPNGIHMNPVGTVPANTQCDPTNFVNNHFAVPTGVVTWYGNTRPKVVFAKCQAP